MKTTDFITMALGMSKDLTMQLIEDMKDAPLTAPTPNGGNHPLWVLGHLVFSEGQLIRDTMLGEENPVAEWSDLFTGGSQPVDDASVYPSMDELITKYDELRAQTLEILASLSDDDLDQPSKNCPEDYKPFFGTYGQCFLVNALHAMMHRGQVADSRRAIGREPLMA